MMQGYKKKETAGRVRAESAGAKAGNRAEKRAT